MDRVALELLDFQRLFIYVGQQAAGTLAIEADGRDQHIAPRYLLGPGFGVILNPVVPFLDGGVVGETFGDGAGWLGGLGGNGCG